MPTPVLRDYQRAAIEAIYDWLSKNSGNCLVAMPTGTGKSLTIAGFIHDALTRWPSTRGLVLTHVKELIVQDVAALRSLWPDAPYGIYSSGLGSYDTFQPVIFGGVKSVINNLDSLGSFDFVLVDECHLISPRDEAVYQKVIAHFRTKNANVVVIGFTATDFRLGLGYLTNSEMFQGKAIDMCTPEYWQWFMANGYLMPPISKRTATQFDLSSVGILTDEYNLKQLNNAIDKDDVNDDAVREIIRYGQDRKSWLIFCSGVEHAEHVATKLSANGYPTAAIHSRLSTDDRDTFIADFKLGRYRALTNNNVLTTGFDHPSIDLIGMLRPTISTSLWVQMLGRGTRPVIPEGYDRNTLEGRLSGIQASSKHNTLVLDFAGNTARLGPIDDPVIPRPKGKGTGEAPVKLCEACGCYNHASARVCEVCGEPFPVQNKLSKEASEKELLSSNEMPLTETFPVHRVFYNRHARKKDGKDLIRVNYFCGGKSYNQFIDFEAEKAFAKHQAHEFWRERVGDELPENNDEAFELLSKGIAVNPKKISVWVNKRPFPEILRHEF